MRVFFMGATKFGLHAFKTIRECNQEIVGCAVTSKVFKISYNPAGVNNVNYQDFSEVAREGAIPAIPYEHKAREVFREQVAALRPDVICVAGWYYLLDRPLRQTARMGAVGLHGSLLPKYRGGAPLVWAMIHGEKETGITLFHLDDGVDTGDVIGQESFPIEHEDTILEVMRKMEQKAAVLIKRYFQMLENGSAPRIPQDHSQATLFPQRKPEDGQIDWSKSPEEIYNFVRAQTKPYPGAFTIINGRKVTIWDCSVERRIP